MISPRAEPVRWLRESSGHDFVVSRVLYRTDRWVTEFLALLTEFLPSSGLAHVHLDTRRPALVLTGQSDTGTLRVAEAMYRDVLLFHEGLHPHVEDVLARAILDATDELARRGYVEGDELRRQGRRALRADPSLVLADEVVAGLDRLGVSGLPAIGVTGIVSLHGAGGDYVLASMRSNRVAINPGCLAPAVDGGIDRFGGDPLGELERELKDEVPWPLTDVSWERLGTFVPSRDRLQLPGVRTLRGGVNLVYHTVIKGEPEPLLGTGTSHFESDAMVAIEKPSHQPGPALGGVLVCPHGALEAITTLPPISEVLVAALAHLGVIAPTAVPDPHIRPSILPSGRATSEASMSPTATNQTVTPTDALPPAVLPERSLEDAWSDQLLSRYPRILSALNDTGTLDLREKGPGVSGGGLEAVLDAAREYELVCRSNQLENVDEARLFEAVVVKLSRNLFANDKDRALAAYEHLTELSAREVGAGYQARLHTVISRDATEAVKDRTQAKAEALGLKAEEVELDEAERDHALMIPNEVAERLRRLDTDEAATAYSEVKRRSMLMCFCAALWSVESKQSTTAADVALEERFRRTLTGDAIALFFRARALLVSPVASSAQTQLGLQFVTTAISYFPTNPGMHHTRALFLLRKSSTIVGEAESIECLEQALASVEEALRWDAEFPIFYATRAKVKYRMHNRSGALVDIRAAIELARYGIMSSAAARDIRAWENLLEGWDLAPVGVASGSGG